MNSFNVIIEDNGKFVPYDIIPYLYDKYKEKSPKPKTHEEMVEFVKSNSMYQWWARCEYEIVLQGWPNDKIQEKWDVHKQVMMNLDLITRVLEGEIQNQAIIKRRNRNSNI